MGSFPSRGQTFKVSDIRRDQYKQIVTPYNFCSALHSASTFKAFFPDPNSVKYNHIALIRASWKKIKDGSAKGMSVRKGNEPPLSYFYDQFYQRLFTKSSALQQQFRGLKIRIGILSRIINFLCCSIDTSKLAKTKKQLKILGNEHKKKNVKPWMYSVFSVTLVETANSLLGSEASLEIFEAWTTALSFCQNNMVRRVLTDEVYRLEMSNLSDPSACYDAFDQEFENKSETGEACNDGQKFGVLEIDLSRSKEKEPDQQRHCQPCNINWIRSLSICLGRAVDIENDYNDIDEDSDSDPELSTFR